MSVKSKVIAATGILLTLGLGLLMMPVLLLTVLGGDDGSGGCTPSTPTTYTGPNVGALTATQMQRAVDVVDQGRKMGIPDQGIVVALATASQESGFRVYANDGEGDDLQPDQKGIEASLDLPHDAVGTDHGSLGVFQQQWPWWGTMRELMDPAVSAKKFYEALAKVDGWQSLPVTVAAQRVQRSAYPDAYADDETLARQLLETLSNADDSGDAEAASHGPLGVGGNPFGDPGLEIELVNGVYIGGTTDCLMSGTAAAAVGGSVAFPLPTDSGYVNQNNFGQAGPAWTSFHTGNDYSATCGTPVLAATGGTVELDDSQSGWAGPNFVRISTAGSGTLATWYAHMETRSVSDGQTVTAGQQIGTVGDLGNSHGCHLHFEVHPTGGGIYDDPVDPVAWLAANVGKDNDTVPVSTVTESIAGPVGIPVTGQIGIATANIPNRVGLAGLRDSLPRVLSSKPDFVTLNEVSDRSLAEIEAAAPGYSAYRDQTQPTGAGSSQAMGNVVLWRTGSWALRNSGRIKIVEDDQAIHAGKPVTWDRFATWALLERADGAVVSVIAVHHMTNPHKFPRQHGNPPQTRTEQYATGMDSLLQLVGALSAHGPVLVGGDMNTHASYIDMPWSAAAKMNAAGFGWYDHAVDFLFYPESQGVTLVNGRTGPMASDHQWVSARLAMNGAGPQVGPGLPTAPVGSDNLTVLTYDINHATDVDALAQEISSSGAAVVALQDVVDATTVQKLAASLRMQFAYPKPDTSRSGVGIDNAILSKYPIVDADVEELPGLSNRMTSASDLLRISVDLGQAAGLVDIYGTQLAEDGEAMAAQAQEISSEIGTPDCATVLMVALHAGPESESDGHRLLTRNLSDPFAEGTFGPGYTAPASAPTSRVDYVLHDATLSVVDAQVRPAGLSDHRAVQATLEFTAGRTCE